MSKKRSWTDEQLREAVASSFSRRQVLIRLGLEPRGGNYAVVKGHMERLGLDQDHFYGQGWNKGWVFDPRIKQQTLEQILVKNSSYQSFRLKKRLFAVGLKKQACELCSWAAVSPDGRIPLELDHINGDHSDNRLENLRVLCPNCHSLQSTHRGRNKKRRYARVL
jgi:hypothetical protein